MFWTGEGQDVVVNGAVLAVPLHAKTLLATLGMTGERPVAEAKPLYVSRLLDDVDDTGGVQRPDAVVSGTYAHCRSELDSRFRWKKLYPIKIELPPPTQSLDRPLVRFRDRKSTRLNSSHTVISYAVF